MPLPKDVKFTRGAIDEALKKPAWEPPYTKPLKEELGRRFARTPAAHALVKAETAREMEPPIDPQEESWGSTLRRRGLDFVLTAPSIAAYRVAGPGAGRIAYGATQTTSDAVNAVIDHVTRGTPISINAKSLAYDMIWNTATAYGTDVAMDYAVPKILGTQESRLSLEHAAGEYDIKKREWMENKQNQIVKEAKEAERVRQAHLDRVEPAARQEIHTAETGATPQTAAAAKVVDHAPVPGSDVEGPLQNELIKRKGLRGTYYSVQKKVFKGLGQLYDKVAQRYSAVKFTEEQRPVVLSDVKAEMQKQLTYFGDRYLQLRGAAPRVFTLTKALLKAQDMPLTEADSAVIRRMEKFASGNQYVEGADVDDIIEDLEADAGGKPIESAKKIKKPLTFADIYNMRRIARRAAATAPDKETGEAMSAIAKSLDQALVKAGLKDEDKAELGRIDLQYHNASQHLSPEVASKVADGSNAIEIGDAFFSKPETLSMVWDNASEEERGVIKDNFGNWAQDHFTDAYPRDEVDAEARAKIYRKMFGANSPLGTAKGIMFAKATAQTLQDSPVAWADYQRGVREELMPKALQGAQQTRDFGVKLLEDLGTVGKEKARQIQAMKDPFQAAAEVQKYFDSMNPAQFQKLIASRQGIVAGPQIAETVGRGGPRDILKNEGIGPFTLFMLQRAGSWPAYVLATALGYSARGYMSPYLEYMALGSAAFAMRQNVKGAYTKLLMSDVGQSVMSYAANHQYAEIGKQAVRNVVRGAAKSWITDPLIGNPLEPEGTQPTPGPQSKMDFGGGMSQAIERKQAEQIATERGRQDPTHLDYVQDLRDQIVSDKTPDIHHDLSSGRLSNEEVAKMLKPANTEVTGLFDGMSLADAMEAFSHGTDDEKSLGLAALAQKIQNEGKNLQPAQRRALMAQLHRALGSEAEA